MILLLSIVLLLAGTFLLKSIRTGAIAAIVVQLLAVFLSKGWTPIQTSAVVNGIAITLELSLLLFGSISFYHFLQDNKRLAFLDRFLATSPGNSYLLIVYCYFLGTFFEGIAGFGVPPILLIPLLARSGFKPLTCVVTALVGSVNAVLFGALGAPLTIGLGVTAPNEMTVVLILINALSCLATPFIIAYLYGAIEGVRVDWKKQLAMHGGAGIIYLALMAIASRFTVEFASVVTGAVGMVVFMLTFNSTVRTWGFKFWIRSFWPYAVLIVLLLTAKLFLTDVSFSLPGGTKSVSAYQPGAIFILAIGLIAAIGQIIKQPSHLNDALKQSAARTLKTSLTILTIAVFSQLIRPDMVTQLGSFISKQSESLEPYFLMLFGVTGAFITGSATMSNLLLSGLLSSATININITTAMLHSGSVLGNIVALQNIVMARSALETQLHDKDVLSYTVRALLICLICVFISAGILMWLRR